MFDRFINNNTVKAVYSDDLDDFLVSNNLMEDFVNRRIKCKYCEKVITRHNLFALIPENNSLAFCCDEPECTEKMIRESSSDVD